METKFTYDEVVRSELERFIADQNWTQAKIAGKLGFTTTRVAKYLNLYKPENTPEPDASRVEAAARHFLRHQARQKQLVGSLFENDVVREVCAAIRQVRRTGDMGLLYSKAGRGKTCGGLFYSTNNPNTLFVTVKQYACGAGAVRRAVFEEFNTSSPERWVGNVPRAEWLELQLRGAERLIIFDDAELMHITAFRFAFSLHDATGTPMVFIGNREILTTLRKSDSEGKLISRVGFVREIGACRDAEATAAHLIRAFAPESNAELLEAAMNVISQPGYVRRLRKQLVLAVNIHNEKPSASWSDCFTAAATNLIQP